MGSTESRVVRSYDAGGRQFNPKDSIPEFIHEITGPEYSFHNNAKDTMDSALSHIKVCDRAAKLTATQLKEKCFSKWEESVRVVEAKKTRNMNLLIDAIEEQYNGINCNVSKILKGIQFTTNFSRKIYEFFYKDEHHKDSVHFGIICVSKTYDGSFDALCFKFSVNFKLAREKIVSTDTFNLFGFIPIEEHTRVEYRDRELGHVTKKQIINYARTKAMKSFQEKGYVKRINYVSSLDHVN